MIDTKGFISVAEAARRMHRSEEQVRRDLRSGKLRGQRIGSQWFIEESSLPGETKEFVPLIPIDLLDQIDRNRATISKQSGGFNIAEILELIDEVRNED